MNEQSEHLSNAQIEGYGDRTSGTAPDDRQTEEAWVEAHLDSCPSCRTRVLEFQRTRFGLLLDPKFVISEGAGSKVADSKGTDRKLADDGFADLSQAAPKPANAIFSDPKQRTNRPLNTASTPDCPSAEDLRQLAAGLLPDAVADQLTRHAATCDHCRPLLRTYKEDFSGDFSPEEQAVMAKLQSSSADWQRETAREMIRVAGAVSAPEVAETQHASSAGEKAGTGSENLKLAGDNAVAAASLPQKSYATRGRRPFLWKWALIPAATAACAAMAFGIWYTQRDTPKKVEKLLARAFAEKRTMEMRIPYAEYADFKETRSGGNESVLSSPAPLRKAAGQIETELGHDPDNPRWLLLKARLDLLDWRYKSALATLTQISDTATINSAEFRLTKSLSLYEKAEVEHDPQSYRDVIDLLGQTLLKTPQDQIALFNQAIACEKLYLYECAISDYDSYLKIDPNSGWSIEVREHLNRIKEKKNPA